jgi:NAD(P) transhydrogenase subunit alpha
MYSKNLTNFLALMAKDGELKVDLEDEIVRETLIVRGGEVVHPRIVEALGLVPASAAEGESA